MSNGGQPVVGGATEMFTIKLPTGAIRDAAGDFTVSPAVPLMRIVITGPTDIANIVSQPDGTFVWDIEAGSLWSVSVE
jgi:hypothetical protein